MFASVFTVADIRQLSSFEPLISGSMSEELNPMEVTRDEVLELSGNLKDNNTIIRWYTSELR